MMTCDLCHLPAIKILSSRLNSICHSSIFSSIDGDSNENDLLSPLMPRKTTFLKREPKTSWVWNHFKDIPDKKSYSFCLLCNAKDS